MKRNIGITAIISTMVAIAIIAVLNETLTVSLEEPPAWRPLALYAAAFFGGVAVATGSLWWIWENRLAKRRAELSQQLQGGLDRSVSWMRQDEEDRLARKRAGINL